MKGIMVELYRFCKGCDWFHVMVDQTEDGYEVELFFCDLLNENNEWEWWEHSVMVMSKWDDEKLIEEKIYELPQNCPKRVKEVFGKEVRSSEKNGSV